MPNSNEVRRLATKWRSGGSLWPKRLDWLRISGLRGWNRQRFDLQFPIMAVVGENGAGKSTLLQAAASVYRVPKGGKGRFASDFFPQTYWEKIEKAEIEYGGREGAREISEKLRKPGERWRGNPERPERQVLYIDLSRIQPIPARSGYTKLVKNPNHQEKSARAFEESRLARFGQIMGRTYDSAKMSLTNISDREVPVICHQGSTYSGFHQGAGETTIAELLQKDWPQHCLVLIDEIESSLHPRAQRRLIRDLAERCRELEAQVILTTHSPYVLEELPPEARAYIMQIGSSREIVYGVSSAFAMTKMDEVPQPECDLYVEDDRAKDFLMEIIVAHDASLAQRCRIIPFGTASVGRALGEMVKRQRFPDPSCVFLDGDQAKAPGCILLPGDDAPERVVFEALKHSSGWQALSQRIGRPFPDVADACERAMSLTEHHGWVREASIRLTVRMDILWQAMCSEWARKNLDPERAKEITQPIEDAISGIEPAPIAAGKKAGSDKRERAPMPLRRTKPRTSVPNGTLPLFEQSLDADSQ